MQLVVFEDAGYENLLPLVYTRATFDLRCGCDSLLEKIEDAVGQTADALLVRRSLGAAVAERQSRAVNQVPAGDDQMWINGRLLLRSMPELAKNTAAWEGDTLLAARLEAKTAAELGAETMQQPSALRVALSACRAVELPDQAALLVEYPWQLVHENDAELVRQLQSAGPKILGRVYPGAHLVNKPAIHLGRESRIKPGAVLDAETGPIHVGEHVTVNPNATITGPCHIGDGCVIQPGASIRGGTSLGPECRVGGEIVSTILQGHSNKQHDGFLGCAYVGEWVNLGADTVNSNLKNTYGPVSVPINGRSVDTGLTFVGAFIGDHVKTGIRVALPTGCVIGFAANVVISGYAPKFVPSFGWLTDQGLEANDPARALAVARKVLARRKRSLSEAEEALFLSVVEEARRHEVTE